MRSPSSGLSDVQFPIPCPTCTVTAGMPYSAGTNIKSGVIEVAMRCRDCGHEWRYEMPLSEPMDVRASRGLRHAAEKLIHH